MHRRPLALGMRLPRLDEAVAVLVGNPVVVLPKEHEELGDLVLGGEGLVPNLPQLLGPGLVADDGHLVHAQVQRLVDAVARGEELGGDLGGVGRHAEDGGDEPAEEGGGEERQEALGEEGHVAREEGLVAEGVEVDALGRLGEVGDGCEEEDARAEVEVGRGGRVVEVAVEELQGDVGAQGVAHENHIVKGLACPGIARRGGDLVGGDEVLEAVVEFILDVVREVVCLVEGFGVVVVVEAGEVAAVDGEGYFVAMFGLDGIEERAQMGEEGGVVVDEAWVAGQEVDEALAGLWVGALVRRMEGVFGRHLPLGVEGPIFKSKGGWLRWIEGRRWVEE